MRPSLPVRYRYSRREFWVYVSGTLGALILAGLATLLVGGTVAKLALWAGTLVVVSLLWGAGAEWLVVRRTTEKGEQ